MEGEATVSKHSSGVRGVLQPKIQYEGMKGQVEKEA